MPPLDISLNWFDACVLVLLLVGLWRGRRNGGSDELLRAFQWLCILAAGAFTSEPLGRLLWQASGFNLAICCVAVYVLEGTAFKLAFVGLQRLVADRLLRADLFGKAEHPLGMALGALRHAAIVLVILSLLSAFDLPELQRSARLRSERETPETLTVDVLATLQQEVLDGSVTGAWVRRDLNLLLIKPAPVRAGRELQNLTPGRNWQLDEGLLSA